MKKKVCIIGVNYSYKILFQSLKILKNFDILGIAGRKKRKEFKKEKFLYYTSWKNMIDELKPDLVVIGVPPKEQEKILEFLLIKNIDFLCEKPITNDLKRINLYKNLVKKNSNKNLIDLNLLTIPAIQKFKNIIKKIEISKKDQIKIEWFLKPRSLKDLDVIFERIAPEFNTSAKSFGVLRVGATVEMSNTKVPAPSVTVKLLVVFKVARSVENLKLD